MANVRAPGGQGSNRCPRCKGTLKRIRARGQSLHKCASCGGRLIGLAPLRQLIGDAWTKSIWRAAGEAAAGNALCPGCSGPMRHVVMREPETACDVCLNCRLLWFDGEGLVQLVLAADKQLAADEADTEAVDRALETVARAELRRMEVREKRRWGFLTNPPDSAWKAAVALFGLPVETESQEVGRPPLVTWTIAALCVVIFLLTWPRLLWAVHVFGFIPSEWYRYAGLTLITSMFLHGGLLHLAVNMYFLLVFGDNVEERLGSTRYLIFYLLAGLVGGVAHGLGEPRSDVPAIGASGAISGVLALYALAFPGARVTIGVVYYFMPRYLEMPAWLAFLFWVGWQLLLALLQVEGVGSVSALAHLGGAATGVLWYILFERGASAAAR